MVLCIADNMLCQNHPFIAVLRRHSVGPEVLEVQTFQVLHLFGELVNGSLIHYVAVPNADHFKAFEASLWDSLCSFCKRRIQSLARARPKEL